MSVDVGALVDELRAAAEGGRVAASGFLDDAEAARLLARLRDAGVAASADGGRPAAERRVVTARPAHLPAADTPLAAVYLAGAHDPGEARAALIAAGLRDADLGDVARHEDGLSVLILARASEDLPGEVRPGGRPTPLSVVPAERVAGGTRRTLRLVVPSLRADVLGAKAFGASRSWFAKGVAAGKVRVDGEAAGKSATLEPGSELWAEGLGRMRLIARTGETKRGNVKVEVEVEKP
jgi:RNA-binding protein YlmH